ncbi:MAG: isochorismatase family protein, partial [Beijerinckiaceae bacterium]
MTLPQTLFELASSSPKPAHLADAALVLIDYQNEYLAGPLALPAAAAAIDRAVELLTAARRAKALIVHVAHKGAPGGMFDRDAHRGAIIDALAPREGEVVLEKPRPNSFSGTML